MSDDIYREIHEDLCKREGVGWKNYGTHFTAEGRTELQFLEDAYDEALDLVGYLKGAIIRAKKRIAAGLSQRSWNVGDSVQFPDGTIRSVLSAGSSNTGLPVSDQDIRRQGY